MSIFDEPGRIPAHGMIDALLKRPMIAQAKATRRILGGGHALEQTLEVAEGVHAQTDEVIRSAMEITPPAQRPVCRRGCSACCHLHASASIPEVIQIGEHVKETWPAEALASLRERVDEHIKATEGMTLGQRLATRLRCPLLDDAGDCSVYPVRPNSCRGWNSRDVGVCEYDLAHPEERVKATTHEWQWAIAGRILEGSAIGSHAAKADHRLLDMVRGVKIALGDPNVSDSWLAGRKVFEDAVQARVFPEAVDARDARKRKDLWRSITQTPEWKED